MTRQLPPSLPRYFFFPLRLLFLLRAERDKMDRSIGLYNSSISGLHNKANGTGFSLADTDGMQSAIDGENPDRNYLFYGLIDDDNDDGDVSGKINVTAGELKMPGSSIYI